MVDSLIMWKMKRNCSWNPSQATKPGSNGEEREVHASCAGRFQGVVVADFLRLHLNVVNKQKWKIKVQPHLVESHYLMAKFGN
ncbi:hypothetical protein GOBAR_AA00561 [Gossypium barbadense]|uniref:Uncharacterized protein n=1 Tax=Gossypium barbadense TaxID=3634 RepID=A0A2P5YWM4_GOSBA|nr:hypothetical protein GOBAR_AA00561 [Gossypium barbadense]